MVTSLARSWKTPGIINSLAISSDGTRIITACLTDIFIWELHTGKKLLGPLKGHKQPITALALSRDGRSIASSSADETIRVWDAETGKSRLKPIKEHSDSVETVIFSPDGCLLISGAQDSTIRFFNSSNGHAFGEPIYTLWYVSSIAISEDGEKIASACNDWTCKIYDTITRAVLFECHGHTDYINRVIFSPDNQLIVSAADDFTIRVWDAETGNSIGDSLEGHDGCIRTVAFSPDGRYLASGSDDASVRIWSIQRGRMQGDPLRGHQGVIGDVAFSPDGTFLVSGAGDRCIKIWDTRRLVEPITAEKPTSREPDHLDIQVTSQTSLEQVVSQLCARGCVDLSHRLNWDTISSHAISSGGFGDIYQGKLKDGDDVAVKTLRIYAGPSEQNQKALKHTAREIYTWSKCQHPNVQLLLGLVIFQGRVGMVTTWELNGSLPEYIQREPDADRCEMSAQVASGLAYLHESGIVHGDLKGANVLVSKEGIALLADFGNASLRESSLQFSKTSTQTSLTPRWAAPELFQGGICTEPADVYALGMTILETITGEVPWFGRNDNTIMFSVVIDKACPERPLVHIPTNSQHGDSLWSLLKSCWEFEAGKRPSAVHVAGMMKRITQYGLVE